MYGFNYIFINNINIIKNTLISKLFYNNINIFFIFYLYSIFRYNIKEKSKKINI